MAHKRLMIFELCGWCIQRVWGGAASRGKKTAQSPGTFWPLGWDRVGVEGAEGAGEPGLPTAEPTGGSPGGAWAWGQGCVTEGSALEYWRVGRWGRSSFWAGPEWKSRQPPGCSGSDRGPSFQKGDRVGPKDSSRVASGLFLRGWRLQGRASSRNDTQATRVTGVSRSPLGSAESTKV